VKSSRIVKKQDLQCLNNSKQVLKRHKMRFYSV